MMKAEEMDPEREANRKKAKERAEQKSLRGHGALLVLEASICYKIKRPILPDMAVPGYVHLRLFPRNKDWARDEYLTRNLTALDKKKIDGALVSLRRTLRGRLMIRNFKDLF